MKKVNKQGGSIPPYTSNGKWEVVEDLAGLPSHAEGGVDLSIKDGKVTFTRDGNGIYAQNGVVIGKKSFKYDNTMQEYNKFKTELESSSRAKNMARLYRYKELLDGQLKAKDPQPFDKLSSDLPTNLKERIAYADSLYKTNTYKHYLNPDEIKKTLGGRYDDYVTLMKDFSKDTLPIAGDKESGGLTDLNYGLRTSYSITPYRSGYSQTDPVDKKKVRFTFGADVAYDEKADAYNYKYSEPQEF